VQEKPKAFVERGRVRLDQLPPASQTVECLTIFQDVGDVPGLGLQAHSSDYGGDPEPASS